MSSHAGISAVTRRELRVGRDDAELLLPGERLLAHLVPALRRSVPLYLSAHSLGTWCGACVAPGAKYMKKGLSGISDFCWRTQRDRLVGHVLGEVVALLRRLRRLDRRGPFVERRVPLVRLAAEEAVEVLEAAAGRPLVERAHRARLPDRHLVALAELRGAEAVELQHLRERGRVDWAAPSCSPAPTSRSR